MSINCVIINSSPLIVLLKSQQAKLIPQLLTEILVPSGVFEEGSNNKQANSDRPLSPKITP
ncbi:MULTISPECIES: hypothetical protein [Nostoc]|uniref:hypothetical protein n=1 Tax=Nostoc TaxID=1177 RepID=UPI001F5550A6|nr:MULTISPECIES: hypothetical protein [Nostoc]